MIVLYLGVLVLILLSWNFIYNRYLPIRKRLWFKSTRHMAIKDTFAIFLTLDSHVSNRIHSRKWFLLPTISFSSYYSDTSDRTKIYRVKKLIFHWLTSELSIMYFGKEKTL